MIGVIGGGIFGCTLALKLVNKGHDVTLIERNDKLLSETSHTNQYRIHKGYHYPRSPSTIRETLEASKTFEEYYPEAIIRDVDQLYGISKNSSNVSLSEYMNILNNNKLDFETCKKLSYVTTNLEGIIKSTENAFCPVTLTEVVTKRILNSKINLKLNTIATSEDFTNFQFVILCAYTGNSTFNQDELNKNLNRFQIVEKIIVEAPANMQGQSIVVMDGEFCSFDPYGKTKYSVIGHVTEAVHNVNVGYLPPPEYSYGNLNENLQMKFISKHSKILRAASKFLPELNKAKYIRSMWGIRTVPHKSPNDARPTYVKQLNKKVFSIYSGKVSTSIKSAETVCEMIASAK